jgi:MFS transporter, ACS family, tartrate transporter
VSGQSSDRSRDRKWHCVAGQAATALFLAGSTIPGQPFAAVMVWLCLTGFAAYFWPSPFWALPTLTLASSAGAVAIGLINMCANLAGYLGNHATGWMKSHGAGDTAVLLFLAASYLLGAVIISGVKLHRPPVAAVNQPISLKQTATP